MDLREQINSIKVVDHHVHPIDTWYWMEAVGSYPFAFLSAKLAVPTPLMTEMRAKSLLKIYKVLYGLSHDKITPEDEVELDKAYQLSKADTTSEAKVYHKVLDSAGIENAISICMGRPLLPPGLDSKRFRRAVCIDGFALPLDNSAIGNNAPQKMFIKMVEYWPGMVRKEANPKSFDDYMNMISTTLEKLQKDGVVVFKVNHAYWRDIAIDVVSKDEAADVFNKKDNSPPRYKKLQDFILGQMIAKAGQLDIPFHVHTGCAPGLPQSLYYADPTRLDPFLWTPDCLNTKIVLLHGSYPFTHMSGFMASRPSPPAPNVYLDVSAINFCHFGTPISLVPFFRDWFEMGVAPKMLYGSDACDPTSMWLSCNNAREAIYLALKGMIDDGLISQSQALMMAQMFLRENAKKLYKNAV